MVLDTEFSFLNGRINLLSRYNGAKFLTHKGQSDGTKKLQLMIRTRRVDPVTTPRP